MVEVYEDYLKEHLDSLLKDEVVVIDKDTNIKKAVIIPYEDYKKLLLNGSFNKFVGILDKEFKTDDEKYNRIVKK